MRGESFVFGRKTGMGERMNRYGEKCRECGSDRVGAQGTTGAGSLRRKCKECGKTWTINPRGRIPGEVETIVRRLISLGIKRKTIVQAVDGIASRRWVYRQMGGE